MGPASPRQDDGIEMSGAQALDKDGGVYMGNACFAQPIACCWKPGCRFLTY